MNYRLEIKYGFWMAVALFLWLLGEWAAGFHSTHLEYGQISILLSSIVIVVGVYHGLSDKNEEFYANKASFGSLAISASLMVLAAAIMTYLLHFLYHKFINSGYSGIIIQEELSKVPEEKKDDALKTLQAMYSPASMAMMAFARIIMFGLVIALVNSGVVKALSKKRAK